uniref:Uncharacterized protein n=1 Tax=Arundo donax TaxID=35708 RepID=A0A0A9B1E4_ARUDO
MAAGCRRALAGSGER